MAAQAEVELGSTIGVEHPVNGVVHLERPEDVLVVGSAGITQARNAAEAAVDAALSAAVATAALRAVRAELAATRRTLRALEQRWIPRFSSTLAQVRLDLEELEHAEGVRHRWAARQQRQ
jgi:vacuolar-type H+-ATPase subunit D/Vma8